jgi:hypothetical protein
MFTWKAVRGKVLAVQQPHGRQVDDVVAPAHGVVEEVGLADVRAVLVKAAARILQVGAR